MVGFRGCPIGPNTERTPGRTAIITYTLREPVRVLITGIGGFAGSHLAEHLLHQTDWEIWGVVRHSRWRVAHLQGRLHLITCDLTDQEATVAMVRRARPDVIVHLAAQSRVGASWQHPWETYRTNLLTQLSLLEAVMRTGIAVQRILVIASNEVYGPPLYLPVDEAHPMRPVTPYGVSKAAQELMAQQYALAHHLPIVRVRPFNHIGPRQDKGFVCADFASQVARIEAGLQPPVIRVGNLSARRDFTDVRDVVAAYRLLMLHGRVGEVYNVGRGEAYAIQEILDILLAASRVPIQVEVDPAKLRPSDVPEVRCNPARVRAHTGWTPKIPFRRSVLDVLDDWRQRVQTANVDTPTTAHESKGGRHA